jgi:Ni/Fe-hydrogenase subunit HybB-like protein
MQHTSKSLKKPVTAVAGLLFLAGLACWIAQLVSGAHYSEQYAWGVYLAGFFAAVGTGAGAMLTAFLFAGKDLRPAPLYRVGFAAFVTAGFVIMADLGSPFNIFSLVFTSNVGAPMVLDFWLLVICAAVCLLGSFGSFGAGRAFAALGVLAAFILLGVEAWLIAMSSVQQLWSVSMGAAPSVLQAVTAGLAVALIVGPGDSQPVSRTFCVLLFLLLAANLIDVIAGRGVNGNLGLQWQALCASGVFWLGLAAGVALPLLLIWRGLSVYAGVTALFGIFCTKLAYLWAGASTPGLDVFTSTAPALVFTEVIVVIGFSALGVLVYQLMPKRSDER